VKIQLSLTWPDEFHSCAFRILWKSHLTGDRPIVVVTAFHGSAQQYSQNSKSYSATGFNTSELRGSTVGFNATTSGKCAMAWGLATGQLGYGWCNHSGFYMLRHLQDTARSFNFRMLFSKSILWLRGKQTDLEGQRNVLHAFFAALARKFPGQKVNHECLAQFFDKNLRSTKKGHQHTFAPTLNNFPPSYCFQWSLEQFNKLSNIFFRSIYQTFLDTTKFLFILENALALPALQPPAAVLRHAYRGSLPKFPFTFFLVFPL